MTSLIAKEIRMKDQRSKAKTRILTARQADEELDTSKAGNHVVQMIGFTEFRAGIRTKHVRK